MLFEEGNDACQRDAHRLGLVIEVIMRPALDHDQFKASGHYTNAVALGVTVETNGPDHIDRVLEALKQAGFDPKRIY